jgi:hypothetical protein
VYAHIAAVKVGESGPDRCAVAPSSIAAAPFTGMSAKPVLARSQHPVRHVRV